MTHLDPDHELSALGSLAGTGSILLENCPAAVYLAQLKQSSRRPQKQALDLVASLLSSGSADCLTLNWGRFVTNTQLRCEPVCWMNTLLLLRIGFYLHCAEFLNKPGCSVKCRLRTITALLVWHPLLERRSPQDENCWLRKLHRLFSIAWKTAAR